MGKRTTRPKLAKGFPLTVRKDGRLCKKVRGVIRYFGRIENPQAALDLWLDQKDDLLAGREPRLSAVVSGGGGGMTVRDLCNGFLTAKQAAVDCGELSKTTFQTYHDACGIVVKVFGRATLVSTLRPESFGKLRARIASTCGPVAVGNRIQRIKTMFKWGLANEFLEKAVPFGSSFDKPNRKAIRDVRAAKGIRMLEPAELRLLIDAASQPLKAMILLGLNAAFGNNDVASLPLNAIRDGWLNFPRPKTGIARRVPLWQETIDALNESITHRYEPKDAADAGLVFVTKYKADWGRGKCNSPVGKEFTKLLKRLGLKRPGISFYTLRHVFATIALRTLDRDAVEAIMGHVPDTDDMLSAYREEIGDDRLLNVTHAVHAWLFGK